MLSSITLTSRSAVALSLTAVATCASGTMTLASSLAPSLASSLASSPARPAPLLTEHPDYNVLFIILDDVGVDQLHLSNPVGLELASTPTMDAIAAQGVNFTNCWSMPECSPSRACFFTGRYPSRHGVVAVITEDTLPQSQCSPFDTTTPMLLDAAGYHSTLIGKYHLIDPELNPAGIAAPASNGFTDFNGTLLSSVPPIDPTIAGQVDSTGIFHSCGFPVDGSGAAICACAFPNGECVPGVDSLECLAAGGIPLVAADGTPILECNAEAIARINWNALNGHYAWPRTINRDGAAFEISPIRKRADVAQAEDAIAYINEQNSQPGQKWMCTLSFSGDHDPWQPPAQSMLPEGTPSWPAKLPLACEDEPGLEHPAIGQRLISNRSIEMLDGQIRRVLLDTGLASVNKQGALTLDAPDTVIVIVGDNGSFFTTVRAPFNPLRAKGTAYQTGVCVPLIAAGGPTVAPGRQCDSMVNIIDLFELFGECANVDVHSAVPAGHLLDCSPMLRYLTDANAPQARELNFTEYGRPFLETPCYPCLISAGSSDHCTDTILASQAHCNAQGGVWYGPTATNPNPQAIDCCDLWSQIGQPANYAVISPVQQALTDGRWKIVYTDQVPCMQKLGAVDYEFYDLTQCFAANLLFGRGIDNEGYNLLAEGTTMTREQEVNYARMRAELDAVQISLQFCSGDITLDAVVDAADIAALLNYWGMPSVGDLNNDGETDGSDLAILVDNWGPCS